MMTRVERLQLRSGRLHAGR